MALTTLTRRALIAAPLLAFAAVAPGAPALADDRPSITIAVQALPPNAEPLAGISNVGLRLVYSVFDTLWRRDFLAEAADPEGGSVLVPHLATSLTQIDPLTWELKLREGVRFHNGDALTAEDVAFTFSEGYMRGEKAAYPEGRILFGHVADVVVVDPLTVRLVTKSEDVVMPHRLAAYGGWIVNHRFAPNGLGPDGLAVGTGPYRLVEFVTNQRAVLEANDDYWMGAPNAKRITFEVVPEAMARFAGLVAGDYDMVVNVLPDQRAMFEAYTDLEVLPVKLDFAHVLYFDTRLAPLDKPEVRQALNWALDYELMNEALWQGEGGVLKGLQLPSYGPLYDPDRAFFRHDPETARALLAKAGYQGEEIVFRTLPYYLNAPEAGEIMQQMWQAAGLNVRLEIVENFEQIRAPGVHILPTSVAFRYPDPLGGGVIVHWGPRAVMQRQGYWSPAEYNQVGEQLAAATDPAERRALFQRMLDIWEAEAPGVIMYQPLELFAKRRSINFTHYPLYYMDFRPYNLSFDAARGQ